MNEYNIDDQDFDLGEYLLKVERECNEEDLDNEYREISDYE